MKERGPPDQECKGAAAILNKKPIKINIIPRLTALIIVRCCVIPIQILVGTPAIAVVAAVLNKLATDIKL